MPSLDADAKGTPHFRSLDGLRGVAALMVFLTHAIGALSLPEAARKIIFGSPLAVFLHPLGAVQLFFILSGFVLASSAGRGHHSGDLAQFYVRRVFRIHPPYVFAVLLTWALSFLRFEPGSGLSPWPFGGWLGTQITPPELAKSLLFPGPAYGQLTVGWSLGVEMIYSLLLPLMMLVALRIHWLALLAAAAAGLAISALAGPRAFYLGFGLHFALGIAAWLERERLSAFFRSARPAVGRSLVLVSAVVFSLPVFLHGRAEAVNQILAGLGGTGILIGALYQPGVAAFLSTPPVAFVGRIAYSFYLLHIPLIVQCGRLVGGPPGPLGAAAFVGLVLFVCLAIACLSFEWIERPSIRAGNALCRIVARRMGAAARLSRLDEGTG